MVDVIQLMKKITLIVKSTGITTFEGRFTDNKTGTFAVVVPLALVGFDIQIAVVNVNIYADNLSLKPAGNNDFSQPNYKELKRALDLILPLIQNNPWGKNERIRTETGGYVFENKQTFINLRVEYTRYNY